MDAVKKLIEDLPPNELRANVRTCVEHTCAAFLGCYDGLSEKQADYVKGKLGTKESDDMNAGDLEYEAMFDIFNNKITITEKFWKGFNYPLHLVGKKDPIISMLLGAIQAIELSPVPSALPHLFEALVTGEWKTFLMIFVDLITPSRTILEVLGVFVMYSADPHRRLQEGAEVSFLEWCKRELSSGKGPVDDLIQSLRQQDRGAT